MTTTTHLARAARQQQELEVDLAERGDAFQTAPQKFTLFANPSSWRDGVEIGILEWGVDGDGGIVLDRENALAFRDWLIATLA